MILVSERSNECIKILNSFQKGREKCRKNFSFYAKLIVFGVTLKQITLDT